MNLNFLKQNINKICEDISKLENKNLTPAVSYSGVRIPHIFFENQTYQTTLNKLIENNELSKLLSTRMIIGTLNKLLKSHLSTNSKASNESIKVFEEMILNIKNYNVYVPILGIEIHQDIFHFTDRISLIEIKEETINDYIPYFEDEYKLNNYSTLLEIKVSAADFEKAMELSIDIANYVVNFLRLVDYNCWDDEDLSIRLPGYGGVKEGLRVFAVDKDKMDGHTSWLNKRPGVESLTLDDITINEIQQLGLNTFGITLNRYLDFQLTEIQSSLLRSLTWFGESKIEVDDGARFVKLMLVIECLLNSNSSDPITATLRDRTAFLLGSSVSERITIAKVVTELYAQRSKIVHHGITNIKSIDLLKLENIASDIIIKFLTSNELLHIENKKQLQNFFEELKYSIT